MKRRNEEYAAKEENNTKHKHNPPKRRNWVQTCILQVQMTTSLSGDDDQHQGRREGTTKKRAMKRENKDWKIRETDQRKRRKRNENVRTCILQVLLRMRAFGGDDDQH